MSLSQFSFVASVVDVAVLRMQEQVKHLGEQQGTIDSDWRSRRRNNEKESPWSQHDCFQ